MQSIPGKMNHQQKYFSLTKAGEECLYENTNTFEIITMVWELKIIQYFCEWFFSQCVYRVI